MGLSSSENKIKKNLASAVTAIRSFEWSHRSPSPGGRRYLWEDME